MSGCPARIPATVDSESKQGYDGSVKTTVDIPDDALRDVVKFTRAKTKREAIVTAIEDFNQRCRMAALVRHSGTFRSLPSNDAIEAVEVAESRGRRGRS